MVVHEPNGSTLVGELGLTPQCASGLAAFYSASSIFVVWLAQRPHMRHWIRQGQNLHDHSSWSAGPLVDLKDTHTCLIQEHNCVEAAPDAAPADAGADNTEARAAALLSLPPLNMLAQQQTLSDEEIGAGCLLPVQSRVTRQVMRHWAPHVAGKEAPPNVRSGACRFSRFTASRASLSSRARRRANPGISKGHCDINQERLGPPHRSGPALTESPLPPLLHLPSPSTSTPGAAGA